MNIAEDTIALNTLRKLLNTKDSQLNALLEATKAINDNVSSDSLYQIYKYTLKEQLNVDDIALFLFDQTWKRVVWETDMPDFYIPVQAHFENYTTSKILSVEEASETHTNCIYYFV